MDHDSTLENLPGTHLARALGTLDFLIEDEKRVRLAPEEMRAHLNTLLTHVEAARRTLDRDRFKVACVPEQIGGSLSARPLLGLADSASPLMEEWQIERMREEWDEQKAVLLAGGLPESAMFAHHLTFACAWWLALEAAAQGTAAAS